MSCIENKTKLYFSGNRLELYVLDGDNNPLYTKFSVNLGDNIQIEKITDEMLSLKIDSYYETIYFDNLHQISQSDGVGGESVVTIATIDALLNQLKDWQSQSEYISKSSNTPQTLTDGPSIIIDATDGFAIYTLQYDSANNGARSLEITNFKSSKIIYILTQQDLTGGSYIDTFTLYDDSGNITTEIIGLNTQDLSPSEFNLISIWHFNSNTYIIDIANKSNFDEFG